MRVIRMIVTIEVPEGTRPPAVDFAGEPARKGGGPPAAAATHSEALRALQRLGVRGAEHFCLEGDYAHIVRVCSFITSRGAKIENPAAYCANFLRHGHSVPEDFQR